MENLCILEAYNSLLLSDLHLGLASPTFIFAEIVQFCTGF